MLVRTPRELSRQSQRYNSVQGKKGRVDGCQNTVLVVNEHDFCLPLFTEAGLANDLIRVNTITFFETIH